MDQNSQDTSYVIDREGYIRFNHISEGNEQQVESVIQQLLAES